MKEILPGLLETEVERPAPGLTTHAYLLERPDGNILFYNTGLEREIAAMAEHGGVALHLLSHQDEVGHSLLQIHERYRARLGGHRAELDAYRELREPDIFFDRREEVVPGVEVIPTPGHSPGSVCFYVTHGRECLLFTGDTLYLSRGREWRPGMVPGFSDREALMSSLRLLRELSPTVAIGSAFSGSTGYRRVAPGRWAETVDHALALLRR